MDKKPKYEHRVSRRNRKEPLPENLRTSIQHEDEAQDAPQSAATMSRARRQASADSNEVSHSTKKAKNGSYYWVLLVVSLLASLTFYSFPLFHHLPTGAASLNLYSGFAMNHGLTPYNDFFGSAGPVFYLINRIGFLGGSTWILWLLEILTLFLSGLFAFKIVLSSVDNQKISAIVASFTILAMAGITMGGNNSVMFAMPFALYGVYVLNDYFMQPGGARDEIFILYAAAGAVASLIFPLFFALWIFGFVALLIINIREHLIGRGFYQFLAGLFGFLVVYAVVGYYTLVTQIFYPAIEQAFVLPFSHLRFTGASAVNLLLALVLLLIFGLLVAWIQGLRFAFVSQHKVWSMFLVLLALVLLVIVSLSSDFVLADTLVVLPFVFMFSGIQMANRDIQTTSSALGNYLRVNLALPIVGILFLVLYPFYATMTSQTQNANDKAVASYVKSNTKASDQVFVATNDSNINLLSKRVSKLSLVPANYPKSYQESFDTLISAGKEKLIVLQKGKSIPASLKTELSQSYHLSKTINGSYEIYKIKN